MRRRSGGVRRRFHRRDVPARRLYNLIVRYNQALLAVVLQIAVCSRRHTAEQRCCRWLLMMRDRVESDQVSVTDERLSSMLGVRRSTVIKAMSRLQHRGIISTDRRLLTIVDRAALQSAACECYRAAKATFARLLPDIGPASA